MRKQFLTVEAWLYLSILSWSSLSVIATVCWTLSIGINMVFWLTPLVMIGTGLLFFWLIFDLFTNIRSASQVLFSFLFLLAIIQQFVNVFLPETSFDALWYHLPAIHRYLDAGSLVFTPELYQTAYPQYVDILFLLGYQLGGIVGVKLISLLGALLLYIESYCLTSSINNKSLRIIIISSIALFHVMTWQSSAAYVDIWSAVFFVAGVLNMLTLLHLPSNQVSIRLALTSVFWGMFLGTKFINLGYVPLLACLSIFLLVVHKWKYPERVKHSMYRYLLLVLPIILLGGFWHLRAWVVSGQFLYPMGTEHATPVIQQMSVSGWGEWIQIRVLSFYTLPYAFFISNREYFSPLFLGIVVISLFNIKNWSSTSRINLGIGVYGLLFWFYFPPPSSRYVLGPILILWITVCIEGFFVVQNYQKLKNSLIVLFFVSTLSLLMLRQVVLFRGVPYLLGKESHQDYLNRFRNGFLDEKIDTYYQF